MPSRNSRRRRRAAAIGAAAAIAFGTYGVYAAGLGISGSAGSSQRAGADPDPIVTSSCQDGALNMAAQYSGGELDPDGGYTQPHVTRYFLSGVDHDACRGKTISVSVLLDNRTDPHCEISALTNGGFEISQVTDALGTPYTIADVGWRQVPLGSTGLGWTNSGSDSFIEFLDDRGYMLGWPAAEGNTFAELNGSYAGTFQQDVPTEPGDIMQWSFKHRAYGSNPTNSVEVVIGDADHSNGNGHPMVSQGTYAATVGDGWVTHAGTYTVPNGQRNTRFQLKSLTGAPESFWGNHVDAAVFTPDYCLAPVFKELPTRQSVQASLNSYTWNENKVVPRSSQAQVLGFSIRIE